MTSGSKDETNTDIIQMDGDADLRAALVDIVSSARHSDLTMLQQTLSQLKIAFDPASVTMTSTNIPDASTKLSAALSESQEATQKVFHHVEEQKRLVELSEGVLAELEKSSTDAHHSSSKLAAFIARQREFNKQIRGHAHDILIAQEHQDLVGQKIQKVLRLMLDIDARLRSLLALFRIATPTEKPSEANSKIDEDIDQDAANQILKDFGL